jgi:hypothetical protein
MTKDTPAFRPGHGVSVRRLRHQGDRPIVAGTQRSRFCDIDPTSAPFAPDRNLHWRLDRDAWYFGQSLIVLFMIGGMAFYGFLVALGGRPSFGEMQAG